MDSRGRRGSALLFGMLLLSWACSREPRGEADPVPVDANDESADILRAPEPPRAPSELLEAAHALPPLSAPEATVDPRARVLPSELRRAVPHCGPPARAAVTRLNSPEGPQPAEGVSVFDLESPVEPGDQPVVVRVQELLSGKDQPANPDHQVDLVQVMQVAWSSEGRLLLLTETPTPRRHGIVNVQLLRVNVDSALEDPLRKSPAVLEQKHDLGHVAAKPFIAARERGFPVRRHYEFSRDGRWLAELLDLNVWNVATGALEIKLELPKPNSGRHDLASMAFSPDDERLAVASSQGIYAYNLEKKAFDAQYPKAVSRPRRIGWEGSQTILSALTAQYGTHHERVTLPSGKATSRFERGEALDPSPGARAETRVLEPEFGFFVPDELRECWQQLVERGVVAPSAERLMARVRGGQ